MQHIHMTLSNILILSMAQTIKFTTFVDITFWGGHFMFCRSSCYVGWVKFVSQLTWCIFSCRMRHSRPQSFFPPPHKLSSKIWKADQLSISCCINAVMVVESSSSKPSWQMQKEMQSSNILCLQFATTFFTKLVIIDLRFSLFLFRS